MQKTNFHIWERLISDRQFSQDGIHLEENRKRSRKQSDHSHNLSPTLTNLELGLDEVIGLFFLLGVIYAVKLSSYFGKVIFGCKYLLKILHIIFLFISLPQGYLNS